MPFFILADNYDDGYEITEIDSRDKLLETLKRWIKLGDKIDRIELIIEGEDITDDTLKEVAPQNTGGLNRYGEGRTGASKRAN